MEGFILAQKPDEIPAPAAWPYREWIVPANAGPCGIDGAAVLFQEHAALVRAVGIQHHSGKALCEQSRMGVLQIKGANIHLGSSAVLQVLCYPIGVQALHHHGVFNITAALAAEPAVKINPVLVPQGLRLPRRLVRLIWHRSFPFLTSRGRHPARRLPLYVPVQVPASANICSNSCSVSVLIPRLRALVSLLPAFSPTIR